MSHTPLIDVKLERVSAPLGVVILQMYFMRETGEKVGFQWPIPMGESPDATALSLHMMASGIEKTFLTYEQPTTENLHRP